MFSSVNRRLESYFPNSTRGKNRYITYTALGVVVGFSAYTIYKMACHKSEDDDDTNDNTNDESLNDINLENYNVLVTNGTSKSSKEIIRKLLKLGCTVFMACPEERGMEDSKRWIISKFDESVREKLSSKLILMPLDVSNLNDIQQFVASFLTLNQPLNFLINNQDLMPSSKYEQDKYQHEKLFAYNYLNTFYLTMLLTPKLIESSKKSPFGSRVINISSPAFTMAPTNFHEWIKQHHEKEQGPAENEYNTNGWSLYGISKAALIIWTREYNQRYEKEGVRAFCVNTGITPPSLQKNEEPPSLWCRLTQLPLINKFFPQVKNVPQGPTTTILKAIATNNDKIKEGTYWSDSNQNEDKLRWDLRANCAKDDNKEALLWELTEKLIQGTGLKIQ